MNDNQHIDAEIEAAEADFKKNLKLLNKWVNALNQHTVEGLLSRGSYTARELKTIEVITTDLQMLRARIVRLRQSKAD